VTPPAADQRPIVREATRDDRQDWDRFVASRPEACGYHEWPWQDVFARAFGHRATYLMARVDGAVQGVLPLIEMRSLVFGRFLTSLPFVNQGGVLATSEGVARALLAAARSVGQSRGCRHVELRHIDRRFPDLPVRQHKVGMRLAIGPGAWERLDRKVRNQIRKAEKSDMAAEIGGESLLPEFYAVFARNMRDLGTPVYSRALFTEVLRAFPGRTQVIVVRRGAQPVAAGVTFRTRGTVEVPWASSLREFNTYCPNHLVYWRAIESAVEAGCDTLDFGRSTPHEGTFHFKRQWGAEPVPLHWEYPFLTGQVPDQGPTNPKFRAAIEIWKRCPVWLANAVGPHIVRSIP
jgi:FemAB-related protein (PEP-CTERM system-associated)